jgi:hypothetical protein
MQEQNLIKISDIKEDFSNISIKKYIPFLIKQNIIDNVLSVCTSLEEDGFIRVNYAIKRMAIEFSICNQVSNIDMSDEDNLELYDSLKELGVITYILNNINSNEITFIVDCINEKIEEIYKVDNSLQYVVAQELNKLLLKIPDKKGMTKFIKDIGKQLDKFDPEKLKFVKEFVKLDDKVEK